MPYVILYEENEHFLVHHGTKGQKWGNRLYQYKDGSLTPLGKIHYGIKNRERNNNLKKARKIKAEKKIEKETEAEIKKIKKEKVEEKYGIGKYDEFEDYSINDLKNLQDRLNYENNIRDYYNKSHPKNEKKKSLGKKFVENVAQKVILEAIPQVLGEVAKSEGKKFLKSVLNDNQKKK